MIHMVNKFNEKQYVLLIFLFFLILFSINCLNATDPDNVGDVATTASDNNTLNVESLNADLLEVNTSDNNIPENQKSDGVNTPDRSQNVICESNENESIENDIPTSLNAPSNITMKYHDGTQLVVTINCNESLDGKYLKMILDNETYWRPINDNKANLTIYSYVGTHHMYCEFSYSGYITSSCWVTINVLDNRIETNLNTSNMEMYYKDGSSLLIHLTDVNGSDIVNNYVNINIYNNRINRTYFKTTDTMGIASVTIEFGGGEYNVFATFRGNNEYKPCNVSSKIVVHKYNPKIIVDNFTKYYGEDNNLTARIVDDEDFPVNNAYITVKIGNKTYYKKSDDEGYIYVPLNFRPGNYVAMIDFNGSTGYEKTFTTTNILIKGHQTEIISEGFTKYYRNETNLEGQLLVHNGTSNTVVPLNDTFITIFVNNRTYYRTSDSDGRFNLTFSFRPGDYYAVISYRGYGGYLSSNKTVHIKVIAHATHLVVSDLTKYYRNESNLKGTLYLYDPELDSYQPFNGTYVNISANSKNYNVRTDENGSFVLNVNFYPGVYSANVSYNGRTGYLSSTKTITITVLSRKTRFVTKNLTGYYGNTNLLVGNLYVTNDNGTEEPFNATYVNITVNSKSYNVRTDENGTFKLNVSSYIGGYPIIINYKGRTGYLSSNKIIFLNILKSSTFLSSNSLVKYYRDSKLLIAHLESMNHKAISRAYINITINGKTYSRRTNETGDANLTINLGVGNYTVDLYYSGSKGYLSSTAKVNVTVRPIPIVIQSLGADIVTNGTYSVKVFDENGNPVNNVCLVFNIRNRTYYRYTNSDGIASLILNLKEGNYNMDIRPANGNYEGDNLVETVFVKPV